MKQTVLILGTSGRFGSNAVNAFETAGWNVRRFDRKNDKLETAANGVDVIVNAWNPAYSKWEREVMAMQPAIHKAALANDATVIIPGNVYVFGETTPSPWSDTTPHRATNMLGKIRIAMEQSYRDAGVRTINLRSGDYLDTSASGNWFDKIMAPSLTKGVFTSPGGKDVARAWAFLPDLARAAVMLAEKRDDFERFTEINFAGYTLSTQQLADAAALARGHDVRVKEMAWWPLRFAWPFMPDMKHLFEMRYLWNTPHWLDDTKFATTLPDFQHTPVEQAMRQTTDFVKLPKGTLPSAIPITA